VSLMMGLCNQYASKNVVSLLHDAKSFEAQLVVVACGGGGHAATAAAATAAASAEPLPKLNLMICPCYALLVLEQTN